MGKCLDQGPKPGWDLEVSPGRAAPACSSPGCKSRSFSHCLPASFSLTIPFQVWHQMLGLPREECTRPPFVCVCVLFPFPVTAHLPQWGTVLWQKQLFWAFYMSLGVGPSFQSQRDIGTASVLPMVMPVTDAPPCSDTTILGLILLFSSQLSSPLTLCHPHLGVNTGKVGTVWTLHGLGN